MYYRLGASTERPNVMTGVVTRGAVVETVEATGTLQPVDTVEVGSQVTGTVKTLGADFNSLVTEGQVLATLDPASLQAQVDQAAATVARLAAEVNRAKVTLADAETKLRRADALSRDQLISAADLDTARSTRDAAQASVVSAQAQVVQGRASLDQARVNIGHTIIRAPSAGVVLSRNVEVGQTVTSGLQTPTLFVIARDLQKMELQASVDEADIAHVAARAGRGLHGGRPRRAPVCRARLPGATAAHRRAERRELHDDDRRGQSGSGAQAGHDGHRAHPDRARRRHAARAGRGGAVPSDGGGASGDGPRTGPGHRSHRRAGPQAGRRFERARGRAAIWTLAGGRLERVPVEVGVSDGALVAVKAQR